MDFNDQREMKFSYATKSEVSSVMCCLVNPLEVPSPVVTGQILLSPIFHISSFDAGSLGNKHAPRIGLPYCRDDMMVWHVPIVKRLGNFGEWREIRCWQEVSEQLGNIALFSLNLPGKCVVVGRPITDAVRCKDTDDFQRSSVNSRVIVRRLSKKMLLDKNGALEVIPVDSEVISHFNVTRRPGSAVVLGCSPLIRLQQASDQQLSLTFPCSIQTPFYSIDGDVIDQHTSNIKCHGPPISVYLAKVSDSTMSDVKIVSTNSKIKDVFTIPSPETEDRFFAFTMTNREESCSETDTSKMETAKAFADDILKTSLVIKVDLDGEAKLNVTFDCKFKHQGDTITGDMTLVQIKLYEGDIISIKFCGNIGLKTHQDIIFRWHRVFGYCCTCDITTTGICAHGLPSYCVGYLQIRVWENRMDSIKQIQNDEEKKWFLLQEIPLGIRKSDLQSIDNDRQYITPTYLKSDSENTELLWLLAACSGQGGRQIARNFSEINRTIWYKDHLLKMLKSWTNLLPLTQQKVRLLSKSFKKCNTNNLEDDLQPSFITESLLQLEKKDIVETVFKRICKRENVVSRWKDLERILRTTEDKLLFNSSCINSAQACLDLFICWRGTHGPMYHLVKALRTIGCNSEADYLMYTLPY